MLIGVILHVEVGDLGWGPFYRIKAQLELATARLLMHFSLQHLLRLLGVPFLRPALLLV